MRPMPIRMRLTGWYLTVIFASLAMCSMGMYLGLRRAIEDIVDRQLQDRSASIGRFLRTNPSQQPPIKPQLLPEASGAGGRDELYQVTDVADAMVFQSPAMRDLDVPLDTMRLRHHYRHYRDEGDFTTYYHRQGDVRVLSSKVEVRCGVYHVQVATIVSPLYEVLQTFRTWVWTGLPLILCAAGLGGYWLSGRAMRPVQDLVLSTKDISERSLSTRLVVPRAQDELRELTNTLNAMLERLETAFTRITRFTSDASHELRTPITMIRTTSEVILERDRSTDDYKEMVGQILRESESASALIEQLLLLARADADTVQLAFSALNLSELVEEMDATNKTLVESRGLRWSSERPEVPVVVLADRSHLRRLLLILIDNAGRYTVRGGSVFLKLTAQGQQAIIEVVDTGIGIPTTDIANIFDRFYRASNARFFDPDGSGLGLSLAQWIATAHGGSLWVHSSIDSGTSMFLRVPLVV